jgi:hypothetical protein
VKLNSLVLSVFYLESEVITAEIVAEKAASGLTMLNKRQSLHPQLPGRVRQHIAIKWEAAFIETFILYRVQVSRE